MIDCKRTRLVLKKLEELLMCMDLDVMGIEPDFENERVLVSLTNGGNVPVNVRFDSDIALCRDVLYHFS